MGMIELKLLQDRMNELEKKIESINTNADMPVNQLLYFQDYKQYKDDSYVHTDPQIKAELFKCPLFFNDPLAKEETFNWFAENCDGEMDRIFRTYNPLKEIGFKGCDYFKDLFSVKVLEENGDYLTAIHNAGDDFIFSLDCLYENFTKANVKYIFAYLYNHVNPETYNFIFNQPKFQSAINSNPDIKTAPGCPHYLEYSPVEFERKMFLLSTQWAQRSGTTSGGYNWVDIGGGGYWPMGNGNFSRQATPKYYRAYMTGVNTSGHGSGSTYQFADKVRTEVPASGDDTSGIYGYNNASSKYIDLADVL